MNKIMLLWLIPVTFWSLNASAQYSDKRSYVGLGASVGIIRQDVHSTYKALDGINLIQEGGYLFGTAGTPALRGKIGVGFFYSAASVPQTIDLFSLSAIGELHLLPALGNYRSKWSPYLVAGVTRNHHSFRGLHPSTHAGTNYSISIEPLLGTVTSVLLTTGGGLAHQFTLGDNFLNLFAECTSLYALQNKTETELGKINLSDIMSLSIGMSFGKRR